MEDTFWLLCVQEVSGVVSSSLWSSCGTVISTGGFTDVGHIKHASWRIVNLHILRRSRATIGNAGQWNDWDWGIFPTHLNILYTKRPRRGIEVDGYLPSKLQCHPIPIQKNAQVFQPLLNTYAQDHSRTITSGVLSMNPLGLITVSQREQKLMDAECPRTIYWSSKK